MFKDNCPISSLDEDKLNRRNFAESLANAIKSYKNPNCLTISNSESLEPTEASFILISFKFELKLL